MVKILLTAPIIASSSGVRDYKNEENISKCLHFYKVPGFCWIWKLLVFNYLVLFYFQWNSNILFIAKYLKVHFMFWLLCIQIKYVSNFWILKLLKSKTFGVNMQWVRGQIIAWFHLGKVELHNCTYVGTLNRKCTFNRFKFKKFDLKERINLKKFTLANFANF